MLDSLVFLCVVGFMMLFALMVLYMIMRNFGSGSAYAGRGSENPRYDDPTINSSGSFGGSGSGSNRPTFDDPSISSRGSFGRPRSGGGIFSKPKNPGGSPGLGRSSGRVDSPSVKSRGSFGKDKD